MRDAGVRALRHGVRRRAAHRRRWTRDRERDVSCRGHEIAQVGGAADVRVPAGARRVNLAGKSVMPMIIDTHVHLSETREALIRDLKA